MQTREQFKTVTHVIPAGNKTAQMGLALIAALAAIIAVSLPIQGHAQTSIPHDWSLKPSGLDTRDKFRLLFASSTKRNANPSDIAIYNTFVQTRAAAGHTDIQAYSAGFKVVGCTGTVDATDNTGTTGTGVPIYWLDGDKVADDYADFYDGSWDSRSPTTETGASVTTTSTDGVITGCSAIGTDGGATLGDGISVSMGNPSGNGSGLSGALTRIEFTHRLYGLSVVFQVSASTDAKLSALVVNDGTNDRTLTPTFVPGTFDYDADVGNAVTTVTLTATVNNANASVTGVTLDGTAIADTDFSDGITVPSLAEDDNEIVVTVTAENNVNNTKDYTVTVSRARRGTTTPTPPGQVEVPNDWSLIPTGLAAGDKFRLLFLSSTSTDGSSYDIADYNTFVQGRAAAGHTDIQAYSSAFRVVGCTSDSDATANTGAYNSAGTGVPIHWLNGNKVADDYPDFYDGSWDDEANDKNELGDNGPDTSQTANFPLTGCQDYGEEANLGGRSLALGQPTPRVGRPNSSATNAGPIHSLSFVGPSDSRPMYGLSQVFEVGAPTDVTLRNLELEGAPGGETILLSPDFDSATETYTAAVVNRVDAVTLTARKKDTTATVAITNDDDTSTEGEAELDLNVGSNTLTVTVTAADTTAKTYTITVTRAAVLPAPTDCPADTDWCTTLGVGYATSSGVSSMFEEFGYLANSNFGDLLSTTFSHGGTSYTVSQVYRSKNTSPDGNTVLSDKLSIAVSSALPDGTVLQLGSRTFTVDTDSETTILNQEEWDLRGNSVSWTAGQHVTASLKFPTAVKTPRAISIADASAAENAGHLVFNVTLSRSLPNTVKVDFETISGGTATEGEDYHARRTYTHVIPPRETTVQMGFALIEDTVNEQPDETVKVRISNARVVDAYGDKIKDLDITNAEATGTITAPPTSTTIVPGLTIGIKDAAGNEEDGWIDFRVRLSKKYDDYVCYDFETISGGTATEGRDYLKIPRATYWMQSGKRVDKPFVRIIDDSINDNGETVKVKISNARLCNDPSQTLSITRAEATGTINNSDPMPLAWMVRFGRTVGSQVVDALGQRLDGATASHVTVGGINLTGEPGAVPEAPSDDPFGLPDWATRTQREESAQSLTANELLLRSAFHLSSGGGQGGGAAYTAWGQVARSGFDAEVDDVTMDADVTSGLIGFDAEWERVLAGVMLSQSSGEGSYRLDPQKGDDAGTVNSSLSGVYPYARLELNRQVSAWALAGAGSGELTLQQEGDKAMPTDITMRMGAVGFKGQVLDGTGASGLTMNVKSDAMWVGTKSERTSDMVATQGDVTRLRVIVEGKRAFDMGGGATFTPSAEVGLRHDAGDAETGTGLEMGAGLSYAAGPLTVEGQVRMLVAHEESGYEEWGASGAIRITPSASGRGLTLSIAPEWGRTGSATEQLWSARDATALGTDRVFEGDARLAVDAGYGVGLGHGVLTPYAGLTLGDAGSRTVRTGTRWQLGPDIVVGLEATRQTSDAGEGANEVRMRAALRF